MQERWPSRERVFWVSWKKETGGIGRLLKVSRSRHSMRRKGMAMKLDVLLVAVDFSEVSTQLYEAAADLAGRLGAKVVVLNVTEPQVDYAGLSSPQAYAVADNEIQKMIEARLNVAKEGLEQRGITVFVEHQWGQVVASILERIKKWDAGMVLVGSHGHGAFYNLLVGSVAAGLIRHSNVPVLVIPDVKASQAPSKK
jgi:nucleotide-binding universal stress UspA family protein